MARPVLEGRFVESTPEQVRATEEALVRFTKEASAPPDLTGQPGKWRIITKIWLSLLPVSIAAFFFGEVGMIVGLFGVMSAIPGLLITGFSDQAQPNPRGRRTSDYALHCYLHGVKHGRWKAAFAALGVGARETEVTVPRIRALKSERDTLSLSDVSDLKRYWRTLTGSSKGMGRKMGTYELEPLSTDGDVHRYRVTIDIFANSQLNTFMLGAIGNAFTRKGFRTTFEAYVYRYKSQWWLYSGELGLPEKVSMLPVAKIIK